MNELYDNIRSDLLNTIDSTSSEEIVNNEPKAEPIKERKKQSKQPQFNKSQINKYYKDYKNYTKGDYAKFLAKDFNNYKNYTKGDYSKYLAKYNNNKSSDGYSKYYENYFNQSGIKGYSNYSKYTTQAEAYIDIDSFTGNPQTSESMLEKKPLGNSQILLNKDDDINILSGLSLDNDGINVIKKGNLTLLNILDNNLSQKLNKRQTKGFNFLLIFLIVVILFLMVLLAVSIYQNYQRKYDFLNENVEIHSITNTNADTEYVLLDTIQDNIYQDKEKSS